jgi:hypothetical protein
MMLVPGGDGQAREHGTQAGHREDEPVDAFGAFQEISDVHKEEGDDPPVPERERPLSRVNARTTGVRSTTAYPSLTSRMGLDRSRAGRPRDVIRVWIAAAIRKVAASRKNAFRAPARNTARPPTAGPTVWST